MMSRLYTINGEQVLPEVYAEWASRIISELSNEMVQLERERDDWRKSSQEYREQIPRIRELEFYKGYEFGRNEALGLVEEMIKRNPPKSSAEIIKQLREP